MDWNISVSYTHLAKYLQKIAEMVEKIEQRNIKSGYNDILIAFRGESKDYKETKLMPSLFRNPEYVKKEPLLFELLGDYNVVKNTNMREIEKAIEAQHFVEISRNLDITFNVLPSLYFACKSKEFEDGRLYIFGFPKYFSPHSNYIENVYKKVLEGENIVYDKNFRVMTHGQNNERMYAQDVYKRQQHGQSLSYQCLVSYSLLRHLARLRALSRFQM